MDEVTPSGNRDSGRRPGRGLARLAAVACLAGGLFPICLLQGAEERSTEYEVKAAFLLNFTKFIEWPAGEFADTGGRFTICILGDDPFGRALDTIVEGESVGGRPVAVQRVKRLPPGACQIVFFSRLEKDAGKTLSGLGPGVLTVGEGQGFLNEGGMIAFIIENRRVRFNVRQTAAENAGLRVSSKLLNVARSVEK